MRERLDVSPPDIDHLLGQADRVLYTAKRAGRNRVMIYVVLDPLI